MALTPFKRMPERLTGGTDCRPENYRAVEDWGEGKEKLEQVRMCFQVEGSGDNASTSRCALSVGMGKVQASIALLLGREGQFPSHEAPPHLQFASYHFAPSHRVGSFTQPLIFPET